MLLSFYISYFNSLFEKTWQIVGRMTAEEKKVLLFFWTSVKYLPVEGFRGLGSRLHIYKSHESGDRLPSSHTCFYRLCFPAYSSMPVMQARLKVITQEHIGSSFGTWWTYLQSGKKLVLIWLHIELSFCSFVQTIGASHLLSSSWILWESCQSSVLESSQGM